MKTSYSSLPALNPYFSDSEILSNAGITDRRHAAYTSNCFIVTIGNAVLSISLRSGRAHLKRPQNKLVISALGLGMG